MKAVTAIKINAGNDANGSPRRAYVVLSNGAIVEAIDEGYEGEAALRASYPHLHVSANIDVTPKEYRDMLKFHPSKGMKRNPLSAHAAAIMGNAKTKRKPKAYGVMTAAQRRAYDASDPACQWVKRMQKPMKQYKQNPLYALQVKIGAKPWTIIGKHSTVEKAKADGIRLHKYLPNAAFRVVTI